MSNIKLACPFYKPDKKFTVPFCDNLVSGVPSCVVSDFYPDLDYEEEVARMETGLPDVVICPHFVRSDIWYLPTRWENGKCFFGGSCIHSTVKGFSRCSVDCSRFKK